jgi:hypothetical protein
LILRELPNVKLPILKKFNKHLPTNLSFLEELAKNNVKP